MSSQNRKVNSRTCFTSTSFPSHLLTVRPCTLREAMNVRFRIHVPILAYRNRGQTSHPAQYLSHSYLSMVSIKGKATLSSNTELSPPGVVRGGSSDSFLQ
ncbi:hypothetical protein VNO77_08383 [Canavalia gladiata]|uniref:Uncharacterized protein n=1 Tax=Canavalia gladiata TaxID=3824 RepID=A0AAN9QX11_CANGL